MLIFPAIWISVPELDAEQAMCEDEKAEVSQKELYLY